jgi:hypothetical protein
MNSPIWLGFFALNSLQAWGETGREKYVIYPIYFIERIFYTMTAIKSKIAFPGGGSLHLLLEMRLNWRRSFINMIGGCYECCSNSHRTNPDQACGSFHTVTRGRDIGQQTANPALLKWS